MKRLFRLKTMLVLTVAFAVFLGATAAFAAPWKFGVMSDTQWPNSPDGKNPNVAVNIINHLNQEFINHGVSFVIQVGDLTDKPSLPGNTTGVENLDIRAAFAQPLYDAGIGFYPLRGNHEDKPSSVAAGTYALEFQRIFPQTQNGLNNVTPTTAIDTSNYTLTHNTPVSHPYLPFYLAQSYPTTPTFSVCGNFATEPTMEGLTYSFDCDNVRFVLIDQFTKPSNASHSNLDATDVAWIGGRLSDPTRPAHAFTFAHKHLISENHADNMFGSNPVVNPTAIDLMDSFMGHMQNNGVRYHWGGHDHMHNRAIISSPKAGSTYKAQNIITASDSYKFYIPPVQSTYNGQSAFRNLEKPISQEIFTVGYYIVTVDGPKVTVDYYAMPNGCGGDCDETYDVIPYSGNTPTSYTSPWAGIVTFANPVPFTKHETFGYSLNGIEKVVDQGADYALTDNTDKAVASGETGYIGTTAAILSGTNGSTGKDYNLRPLTKTVDTGWAPKDNDVLDSDILTLWGMQDSLATQLTPQVAAPTYSNYTYVDPNTTLTDPYVLSMTYAPGHSQHLGNGGFGIATKDADGNWINAVDKNSGGTKTFVKGPWNASYGLGTYGVDASKKTAWAVINYNGDFAVANGIEPVPGHRK